jgi:hypothetical protein
VPDSTHQPPATAPTLYPFSHPATTAIALATPGARLQDVSHEPGRVLFLIAGLPENWHDQLARDEIRVSGLAVITQLERVLSLIKAAQQRRRDPR